jgi:hypothetical protein
MPLPPHLKNKKPDHPLRLTLLFRPRSKNMQKRPSWPLPLT